MPNKDGLNKANKKLFPVNSANYMEDTDSSSQEEKMLALALDNAEKGE